MGHAKVVGTAPSNGPATAIAATMERCIGELVAAAADRLRDLRLDALARDQPAAEELRSDVRLGAQEEQRDFAEALVVVLDPAVPLRGDGPSQNIGTARMRARRAARSVSKSGMRLLASGRFRRGA